MKQFILKNEPDKDNNVRLTGDDYHYLVRVRRLAAGEFFPALLPDGEEAQVQVILIDKTALIGKCIKSGNNAPSSEQQADDSKYLHEKFFRKIPPVILFQALPKSDKMDLIVRQAAEGGITEIIPFVSDFTVAKIHTVKTAGADGNKLKRWEKIIKEARQQSGSKIATSLHQPLTFNELLEYWNKLINVDVPLQQEKKSLGILFHHPQPDINDKEVSGGTQQESKTNRRCKVLEKESLHGYLNNIPNIVVLAIGPEGGFSEREVSLFMENGFKILTIGDTILRTETAALYCSAAIRILLLEKDSWEQKRN